MQGRVIKRDQKIVHLADSTGECEVLLTNRVAATGVPVDCDDYVLVVAKLSLATSGEGTSVAVIKAHKVMDDLLA